MAYRRKRFARRGGRRYRPRPRAAASSQRAQISSTMDTTGTLVRRGGSIGPMFQGLNSAFKYGSLAYRGFKLASAVAGMVNAEKKYYDGANVNIFTGPVSSLVQAPFANIVLGDGPNERDGSQIRVKSLLMKGTGTVNASAAGGTTVQLRVVLDRRTPENGSLPAFTDMFDDTSVRAFNNIEDQWNRFKVIKSQTWLLSDAGASNEKLQFSLYLPMSMPIRYNTSQEIVMNNLYFVWFTDQPTNIPIINMRWRARFYDN